MIFFVGCLNSEDTGDEGGRLRVAFTEEAKYQEAIALLNSFNVTIITAYNTTTSYDFGEVNHLIVIAMVNNVTEVKSIMDELNNSNLVIKCSETSTDD